MIITLEKIKEMWNEDSQMDEDLLDVEALKIPQLHSKYLNLLSDAKLTKTRYEFDLKRLYREKWEYFTGKADDEVYKEKPFDLKILKQDVSLYIESDPDFQSLQGKIIYYKEIVYFLEKILDNINTRGFQIKNCIDWRKFMHGVN
jgi:hypothetical protein